MHRQWILPKGGVESDESFAATAARETMEEAGVTGQVEDVQLCQNFKPSKHGGGSLQHWFPLEVDREMSAWSESWRQRQWLPVSEAVAQCERECMKEAIEALIRHKSWDFVP